jgi:hypothetical protein
MALLPVQLFVATSGSAQHPSVDVTVPAGLKILGGGAFDHWSGVGNMLTASYPKGPQTWSVSGKDHEQASSAFITAYALALNDPQNEWDVTIKSETSNPAPHPQAVATLPQGYTLTGGGAFVDYHGAGNLLTASFPSSDSAWEARSKDHDVSDPSRITAYAIGIRHRTAGIRVAHVIRSATGGVAPHPNATICLDPGFTISGGGALDNWDGAGNLLTALFPFSDRCWFAAGKDHIHSSPATITAYVIGIHTL